ncbi:MAG: cyclic nucleotide-binding domain-containing protein [Litoreibacter sp.]|nr:cyclic nucleotide-binding domain-containing protein [Litoreibacter sp.]MCY4333415.1 cyclic nucleotide-binding domain-containing protein [Litoreibacter sp.]
MSVFSDSVFEISGLLGVAFYLGGYAALQFGFVRGSGYAYTLLNLLGASFVLVSLWTNFNLASLLIQVSWITLSVVGLTRLYVRNRALHFTSEELQLLEDRLPTLSKPSAKDFFRAGGWADLEPGEGLLREGRAVEHLFYLAQGEVTVHSGENEITRVEHGFLGEISVLDGKPASASVTTATPSKVFVIARTDLKRLMAKDTEFGNALEAGLSRELGRKLVEASRRLIDAPKPG